MINLYSPIVGNVEFPQSVQNTKLLGQVIQKIVGQIQERNTCKLGDKLGHIADDIVG